MWKGSCAVRGANGKVSNVIFNLVAENYADAKTALDTLAASLARVSDGVIVKQVLAETYAESALAGAGDIFERAAISAHINQTGQVDKFATVNVPAPVIGMFLDDVGPNRDVVDTGYADLATYIGDIAQFATVSDGETINVALGPDANGIAAGRRVW